VPVLPNQRHERYAQELAQGKTATEAYVLAGFKPSRQNAARLRTKDDIAARVLEIQHAAAKSAEITIQTVCAELDDAISVARSKGQANAMVSAAGLRAKLAGLMVEKVEIGRANEFEDCNTAGELLDKVRREAGDDAAELCAALCGLNADGSEALQPVSSLPFRRKLARLRARTAEVRLLREAVGPNVEVEITDQDIAEFRALMNGFDALVDAIKDRGIKLIEAPRLGPSEVEKRKMIAHRNRTFGGNGGRRY
jgi:hypothetical protein